MSAIDSYDAIKHALSSVATDAPTLLRDPMTGLYNKNGFIKEGNRLLPLMVAAGDRPHVVFIEIRNYEGLVSRLDFESALELLNAIRRRLELAFGSDALLARFDSERFAALLPQGESDLSTLLRVLEAPLVLARTSFHLSITCGVAAYPDAAENMDMLVMAARIARSDAVAGNRTVGLFAADLRNRLARSRAIEDGLWTSRGGGGLSLLYQPKIDIQTGLVMGVEALMRWNHPELGKVGPSEFIPVAEQTRAIVPIGEWLIRESLRQQAAWREKGQDIAMSINISPVQLHADPCTTPVLDILTDECQRLRLDRARVELEITEGLLTDAAAMAEVRRIRQAGFGIAIDDFGRDHSGLSMLVDCPVTTLKIDKSFVDNILRNERQASIIRFITELAHHLGMRTVVEGIEHLRQLVAVAAAGCDYGQGFFYFRPLCAARILDLRHRE